MYARACELRTGEYVHDDGIGISGQGITIGPVHHSSPEHIQMVVHQGGYQGLRRVLRPAARARQDLHHDAGFALAVNGSGLADTPARSPENRDIQQADEVVDLAVRAALFAVTKFDSRAAKVL